MQKILKTRFSTDESILMDIKKGGKFVQFQYANILPLGGGYLHGIYAHCYILCSVR